MSKKGTKGKKKEAKKNSDDEEDKVFIIHYIIPCFLILSYL